MRVLKSSCGWRAVALTLLLVCTACGGGAAETPPPPVADSAPAGGPPAEIRIAGLFALVVDDIQPTRAEVILATGANHPHLPTLVFDLENWEASNLQDWMGATPPVAPYRYLYTPDGRSLVEVDLSNTNVTVGRGSETGGLSVSRTGGLDRLAPLHQLFGPLSPLGDIQDSVGARVSLLAGTVAAHDVDTDDGNTEPNEWCVLFDDDTRSAPFQLAQSVRLGLAVDQRHLRITISPTDGSPPATIVLQLVDGSLRAAFVASPLRAPRTPNFPIPHFGLLGRLAGRQDGNGVAACGDVMARILTPAPPRCPGGIFVDPKWLETSGLDTVNP